MELSKLISFYHVVRFRSLAKAADHLNISQPTVSKHLKKLEEELGLILFDRMKRPIRLTTDGSLFYDEVGPLVEGLEAIDLRVKERKTYGAFRLGALPEFVDYYLPRLLKQFKDGHPNAYVMVSSQAHHALLNMLMSSEIDLALTVEPVTEELTLDFAPLFTYNTVLVAPVGHELLKAPHPSIEEILRWPLIISRSRGRLQRLIRQRGLTYTVAVELDNMESIKTFVELGMGVAIVADFAWRPGDEARLGSTSLSHIFPPTSIGLVTLKRKFLNGATRRFMQVLTSAFTKGDIRS